jgi:hypothetical protein
VLHPIRSLPIFFAARKAGRRFRAWLRVSDVAGRRRTHADGYRDHRKAQQRNQRWSHRSQTQCAPCRPGWHLASRFPADFGKLIAAETEKWAQVIRAASRCSEGDRQRIRAGRCGHCQGSQLAGPDVLNRPRHAAENHLHRIRGCRNELLGRMGDEGTVDPIGPPRRAYESNAVWATPASSSRWRGP